MIAVQITKNFPDPRLRGGKLAPEQSGVSLSKIEKLVKAICNRFKLSNATVSIAIVDDAQMRKVNAEFTNRKSTTDCLSFDLSDDEKCKSKTCPFDKLRAGSERSRRIVNRKLFELVVNGELALKQANLRGHSREAELALYITHSLLHNLGFDDSTQSQAEKMHDTEDEILQQFGYGSVYDKNR